MSTDLTPYFQKCFQIHEIFVIGMSPMQKCECATAMKLTIINLTSSAFTPVTAATMSAIFFVWPVLL